MLLAAQTGDFTKPTGAFSLASAAAKRSKQTYDPSIAGAEPAIDLVVGPEAAPTDAQDGGTFMGGKKVGIGTAYYCTSGFVVNGGGGEYGITAGHCGSNLPISNSNGVAVHRYADWSLYGYIQNTTYNIGVQTADAEVFHLGSLPREPWVWNTATSYRTVVAQADAELATDPTPLYAMMCLVGARSITESCGNVISTDATASYGNGVTVTDMLGVVWHAGDVGAQKGDSGGPVDGLTADGSAIALGLQSGCQVPSDGAECTPGGISYVSKINNSLNLTGTSLKTAGRPPYGWHDTATGGGGTVSVTGWAIDPDLSLSPLQIHVYVGGPAGSGAPGYAITANTYRPDVGASNPYIGDYHGFTSTITTSVRGTVPIYTYAIGIGGAPGSNTLLQGSPRYVTIS
ncbi:hypothetical protein [Nocardioides sp.]|uniref:hypothetical protein n=1 Tax=Nocardioides sp. TaxID=35761 RepID=UPI0039E355D1